MATVDNKENVAPSTSSDPLQHKSSTPSPKKAGNRRGRSKSIGPGGLHEPVEGTKQEVKEDDAKNRRKSTYVPATKSIISNDTEKAERQAARRKTLANRRVSFALEATLHTWDVVEFMRDQTTSTDSSDNTRRTERDSPYKRSSLPDSDPPSTPPEDDGGVKRIAASPAQQQQKKRRRSSTGPPVNLNDLDDEDSSGLSDAEESGDEDADGSEDDTGTAMSLDVDNNTVQSLAESDASSTGSSARLEAALRQAAETAGTRGIEYDEYGDGEASMELASEEVTNAFKPWVEQREANQPPGSASLDQENVNPFSPAFKAQLVSGTVNRPATVEEENTGDMSMDMTRAVGGIVNQPAPESPSSQLLEDGTMDLTQAVGKIQRTAQLQSPQTRNGQKRRRSTADTGSPGVVESNAQSKRRRSSMPRQSLGDETMDLTTAIGGVQNVAAPAKPERRRGAPKRRSSGVVSDQDDATMDFTQAIGGVKPTSLAENTASSLDSNEELTMELTTVLGGIKAAEKAALEGPVTPQNHSPAKDAQNTTPKDQERFKDAPDSGPKKLLTPMFQKQVMHSSGKKGSSSKSRKSMSPAAHTKSGVTFAGLAGEDHPNAGTPKVSPIKENTTPVKSPGRRRSSATPDSVLKEQLDAQLQAGPEPSPTVQKQQRSSPSKAPSTPERVEEPTLDGRRLADSIKLMSTPRKETLKHATPRTQPRVQEPSPKPAPASKSRPTPKANANLSTSPARQLSEDLTKLQSSDKDVEKIALQQFLDLAGIRFMDLTTTKRRMTHATTPSKAKKAGDFANLPNEEAETNLESAILAAGCTLPELESYEHACHDLKRHIADGKRVVASLETATAKATPPLIKAYMAAGPKRKAAIDSQMRDIKTQARLRSREWWYEWRTQLMEDLMGRLQGVGEGLIRDDEVLGHMEGVVEGVLPGLVKKEAGLRAEAEGLEVAAGTSEEEKEDLEVARERLLGLDGEVEEKQRVLEELKAEMERLQTNASDLEESKEEFVAAIREAERVKEACRGVSVNEVTTLQESISNLESTTGWTITSASSSPATITMTYKSHLKLFFHPTAFANQTKTPNTNPNNHPISLTYTAPNGETPGTTLRFFLQLLRASLQALHQPSTPIPALLHLVSSGWDTALTLAETERRLRLVSPTESRILSDERLLLETSILLPAVRTKVRVGFGVVVSVGEEGVNASVEVEVKVVYGEPYNEKKMVEFVERELGGGMEGWEGVVGGLRERLVARGRKG